MAEPTIVEIADALSLSCAGEVTLPVAGLSEPALAASDQLAVAMDQRYLGQLAKGNAKAALVPSGTDWQNLGLRAVIFVDRPRLALAGLCVQQELE